jgi:hypothetical protein
VAKNCEATARAINCNGATLVADGIESLTLSRYLHDLRIAAIGSAPIKSPCPTGVLSHTGGSRTRVFRSFRWPLIAEGEWPNVLATVVHIVCGAVARMAIRGREDNQHSYRTKDLRGPISIALPQVEYLNSNSEHATVQEKIAGKRPRLFPGRSSVGLLRR